MYLGKVIESKRWFLARGEKQEDLVIKLNPKVKRSLFQELDIQPHTTQVPLVLGMRYEIDDSVPEFAIFKSV